VNNILSDHTRCLDLSNEREVDRIQCREQIDVAVLVCRCYIDRDADESVLEQTIEEKYQHWDAPLICTLLEWTYAGGLLKYHFP
jgi:hypothetical protein